MSFVLRTARGEDLAALYRMAESSGGMTNLPPDRSALRARLERSAAAFGRDDNAPGNDLFLFILEDTASGEVKGTCQIFAQVGSAWPFYSYRIDGFSQYSEALAHTIRTEMLTLSTDLGGCSEIGGLFLTKDQRSAGTGALLARSRYLFIRAHRSRFADCTLAELRGVQDEEGNSPFWDGVAGRFFGMTFHEADEFNAVNGNQFIADLMPKHPIYTALLFDSARAVIGLPHRSGLAAMRMLENEGFIHGKYVDIFDGGPTMTAPTDSIATIRKALDDTIVAVGTGEAAQDCLVAHGRLSAFRACHGRVASVAGGVAIDSEAARTLGVSVGDRITHVPR